MAGDTLSSRVEQIGLEFEQEIEKCDSSEKIESLRVAFLGKKGHLKELTQFLTTLTSEEKKSAGQEINQLKGKLTQALSEKKKKSYLLNSFKKKRQLK